MSDLAHDGMKVPEVQKTSASPSFKVIKTNFNSYTLVLSVPNNFLTVTLPTLQSHKSWVDQWLDPREVFPLSLPSNPSDMSIASPSPFLHKHPVCKTVGFWVSIPTPQILTLRDYRLGRPPIPKGVWNSYKLDLFETLRNYLYNQQHLGFLFSWHDVSVALDTSLTSLWIVFCPS